MVSLFYLGNHKFQEYIYNYLLNSIILFNSKLLYNYINIIFFSNQNIIEEG